MYAPESQDQRTAGLDSTRAPDSVRSPGEDRPPGRRAADRHLDSALGGRRRRHGAFEPLDRARRRRGTGRERDRERGERLDQASGRPRRRQAIATATSQQRNPGGDRQRCDRGRAGSLVRFGDGVEGDGRTDLVGLGVDRRHRLVPLGHGERRAGVRLEPEHVHVACGDVVEVDAGRLALHRVQRVHEGMLATVIEGVGPAAVGGGDPREREAVHLVAGLVGVDDRPADQPLRGQVERAHVVLGRIAARRVIDQVHRPAVGRKRIEGEVAIQLDRAGVADVVRVEDLELGRLAREPRARADQDERSAVGRESRDRAVQADDRDRVEPVEPVRARNLPAVLLDPHQQRVSSVVARDVAEVAGLVGDPVRADVLDRQRVAVAHGGAGDREEHGGQQRGESFHGLDTDRRPSEVPRPPLRHSQP